MKEQVPLPVGEKESEGQQESEPKTLDRPKLPQLPRRITGYRCVARRQGIDFSTGKILDEPCGALSDDPVGLCRPEPIYEGEEEEKKDA